MLTSNSSGYTALDCAIVHGREDTVTYLLRHAVFATHVTAVDVINGQMGTTPLMLAVAYRYEQEPGQCEGAVQMIKALVAAGMDVDGVHSNPTFNTGTPLMRAVRNNAPRAVVFALLDHGANVLTSQDGIAVLNYAAANGDVAVVEKLTLCRTQQIMDAASKGDLVGVSRLSEGCCGLDMEGKAIFKEAIDQDMAAWTWRARGCRPPSCRPLATRRRTWKIRWPILGGCAWHGRCCPTPAALCAPS